MDSTEKGLGVLSYFGPLFIITLIAGNSSFTKFHANQGLVLFIIEAIVGAVCGRNNRRRIRTGFLCSNAVWNHYRCPGRDEAYPRYRKHYYHQVIPE